MRASHGNPHKSILLRISVALVFLLGAAVMLTNSSEETPEEVLQTSQWVNQLVTPLKNVSLSQILGRWYSVEQVRNFSFQPEDICETFDFFLHSDNSTVLLNQTLSRGSDAFNLPETTVLPDGSWAHNLYSEGFKVLDISADGAFLSLASCNRFVNQCYGVVLARDADLSGQDAALQQVHRGMAHTGLNDTHLGHRQRPDACRPGARAEGGDPVKQYDV